jgi:hypothetical protein
MSRFNVFLHRTGERLALPKATRSLILVEIASDLEDLFQHYLHEGLSEEEAAAKAEEKVDAEAATDDASAEQGESDEAATEVSAQSIDEGTAAADAAAADDKPAEDDEAAQKSA